MASAEEESRWARFERLAKQVDENPFLTLEKAPLAPIRQISEGMTEQPITPENRDDFLLEKYQKMRIRQIKEQGGWKEGYSREEFEQLPDGTVLQEEAVGMPYVKVGGKIVPKHELFVPATDQLAKFIVTGEI